MRLLCDQSFAGCWNSRRKPPVSKLFSRQWCARRGTLRVSEIPVVFRERVHGKSKMSFGVALRFFSTGCTRPSSISSARASRRETKRKPGWRSGGVTSRGSRKVARMHRARRGSSCRPALRRSRPYRDACRWRSNICLRRRYNQSSFRCSTEGA